MIAIIDYGVGNLFSLTASLKYLNIDCKITDDETDIRNADRLILPGVGAFSDAIEKLNKTELTSVILDEVAHGKPILGICLGCQMLFEKSYEYGEHIGLGLLKGCVLPLKDEIDPKLKVPQIGWNKLLCTKKDDPLLKYTKPEPYVYYVHSYYIKPDDDSLVGYSEYDINVTGYVHKDNVYGTQFHPEKSGEQGLLMLKAFNEV